MNRTASLVLAAALAALAACERQGGEGPRTDRSAGGFDVTAVDEAPDDVYGREAAVFDLYATAAGRLGAERARDPQLRALAQTLAQDHAAELQNLSEILRSRRLRLKPPTELDARRQRMIDELEAASGPGFDALFLQQMTAAHQEGLLLHNVYVEDGDNRALRGHARRAAERAEAHRRALRELAGD